MTFTVITEMKKRFKEKEIVLLSRKDFDREQSDKNRYNFKILPWNMAIKSYLLGGRYSLIASLKDRKKYMEFKPIFSEIKAVIQNAFMMIDISGYSLSSQTSKRSVIGYISNIMVAKKFNIPMWLFPQSFGPFEFIGPYKWLNKGIIKRYLKYPKRIFVREENGYKELMQYTDEELTNIMIMPDIVLQSNSDYNISSIYNDKNINLCFESVEKNALGIIPNMRVVERVGESKILDIYQRIILALLEKGKHIYILKHSFEDGNICANIKKTYPKEDRVVLMDNDYNCIQLEGIIQKFDYIIGSRYHSIIHAFKNGVPAIAIGWAVKYKELMNKFEQDRFVLNISNDMSINSVLSSIDEMDKSYIIEKSKILEIVKEIQKHDVFDIVEQSI
jgi:colanic acid/amylovoran biosynthesis protein